MWPSKLFFLFLFLSLPLRAQVGRAHFQFAYANLETFVDLCLADTACQLNPEQKQVLTKIRTSLPKEKANSTQLTFASEKKNPGLFILNGELKVAKTFDEVGSIIYVNLDMIEEGPMLIQDGIAILVHELGHHHGIKDETFLDLLGLKVSFYYQQRYLQIAQHPQSSGVMVSAFNYWLKVSVNSVFRSRAHFDLLISDDKKVEVLSIQFRSFECSAHIPRDTRCDDKPSMVASNVQNLTWLNPTKLTGKVTFICKCLDNSLNALFSVRRPFEISIQLSNNTYRSQSAVIRIQP